MLASSVQLSLGSSWQCNKIPHLFHDKSNARGFARITYPAIDCGDIRLIFMAKPPFQFVVAGEPYASFRFAVDALAAQGFAVTSQPDHYRVVMEYGSEGATIALGAFSGKKQHLRVFLSAVGHGEYLAVYLEPDTTGMMAGLIGVSRAKRAYESIARTLATAYQQQGLLVQSNVA